MQPDPLIPAYVGKSAYHGDVAINYERDRVGEEIWGLEQAWVAEWLQTLQKGAAILDIPVGTGRFVPALLGLGLRVHGADISDDMLRIAAKKRGEGVLVLEKQDVESLGYNDGAFDHVICWRLFHLLPPASADRALRELARVCCVSMAVQFFGVEKCPFWREQARRVKRWLQERLGRGESRSGGNTPWAHILSYSYTERGLSKLFARAQLELVEMRELGIYKGESVRVYVLRKKNTGRAP
jgi:hypothetical protein